MRAIAKRDLDVFGAFDDVIVGHDVAARVNYEPRTRALDRHGILEEIVFHGLRDDIRHSGCDLLVNSDRASFFFGQVEPGRQGPWLAQRLDFYRSMSAPTRTGPVRRERQESNDRRPADSVC